MKRKMMSLIVAVGLSAALIACGQKDQETGAPAPETTTETDGVQETPETEDDTDVTEDKETAEDDQQVQDENDETSEEEKEPEEEEADASDEKKYADNFAVSNEDAAAFAEKIKAVVADKDLEGLADLTSFPMYAGFADGGVSVKTREEFIELGADRIFTTEMMDSIAGAETDELSPSMAGFSLSASGRPNMIFGVVDGKLAISGMNY